MIRGRPMTADTRLLTLFEEHSAAVAGYVRRLTRDRDLAEDVLQETMVRAWQHANRLDRGTSATRAWMLHVARNIVYDRYRARRCRPLEDSLDLLTLLVADRETDDHVLDSIVVSDALALLRPSYRVILEKIYLNGLSIQETAEALGIPQGTVKSRSHYARRAFRQVVEQGVGFCTHPPGASGWRAPDRPGHYSSKVSSLPPTGRE